MKRVLGYTIVVGIYVLLFVARVAWQTQAEANETLPLFVGETAEVAGVVVNDPEYRATSVHAYVRVERAGDGPASGVLLAVLPRSAQLEYGDTVVVQGKIELPEAFETDTGRMFDYAGYLRVRGVSTIMKRAEFVESSPGSWSLQKSLFTLKHEFEHSLEKLFPEPSASLLEGIELGERRGLPQELTDAFVSSGLIHVVVLSGYNISVVAEGVMRATSFLPKTLNYSAAGILIMLFAVMSGAGATTVRACIMGLIAILARYLKRPADALRALAVAAAAMALWNPHVVVHDPSFILSVLATFGLITLSTSVEKYLMWMPERFGIRSIAASTIAVQIFVLPMLLYLTGVLSFLALPANILVLPVVPLVMLGGFVAGVLGFVSPLLALPFTITTHALLSWMMWVAQTVHTLPFGWSTVQVFPFWTVAVSYVPLTALALYCYKKSLATT